MIEKLLKLVHYKLKKDDNSVLVVVIVLILFLPRTCNNSFRFCERKIERMIIGVGIDKKFKQVQRSARLRLYFYLSNIFT